MLLEGSRRHLLVLFVATVGCAGEPRPDTDPALPVVPADQYLQLESVRLHYLDWGGEGDLLLFIPGVTGTAHLWNAVAPRFVNNYRVIAVTRREHGSSEKTGRGFDLDILADDLAGVIEAFSSEPAIVVGHSYAGLEMPRLYRRHPVKVRALVFVDALYDGPAAMSGELGPPGFGPADSTYPTVGDAVAWSRGMFPGIAEDLAERYLRSQMRETEPVVWQIPVPSPTLDQFFALSETWAPSDYEGIA